MALLYARILSDIRSQIGCRGEKFLNLRATYNFNKTRKSEGGLQVVATHNEKNVEMLVSLVEETEGEVKTTPVLEVVFLPGNKVKIKNRS